MSSSGRPKIPQSSRFLRTFAWASLCLALSAFMASRQHWVFAAAHKDPLATSLSDKEIARSVHSDSPQFRLGDAGRPFGWSTVIADFNTDGEPDVAVADHIAQHPSGYAYRLEFSISGQAPRNITFESRHEAITIRIADVDGDNDLDILVGTPLSVETVGIWLNDGHGHFTAEDPGRLPETIQPLQSFDTTDRVAHFAALDLSPRRTDSAQPAMFQAAAAHSDHRLALSRSLAPRSALPSSCTSPRAPPSADLDALS